MYCGHLWEAPSIYTGRRKETWKPLLGKLLRKTNGEDARVNTIRADKNLISLVVGMNFSISPHKTFFLEHINQSMLKKKKILFSALSDPEMGRRK